MLEKLQIEIDSRLSKCCFSSIMKPKLVFILGALLAAVVMNSCSSQGGMPGNPEGSGDVSNIVTGGLRSGDSAINRNDIDALLNNPNSSRIPWSKPRPERPGLATGWGDEKKSEMTYVSFNRASSKPAGTNVIFYNNPEGLNAMVNYKSRVGAMQTAAGEMVEWGIKGRSGYLPSYKENGYGRRLVAGKKGSNYSIVVKNRCKSALEIVAGK